MRGATLNWDAYAQPYDIVAYHNPTHQEILDLCVRTVSTPVIQEDPDAAVDLVTDSTERALRTSSSPSTAAGSSNGQ